MSDSQDKNLFVKAIMYIVKGILWCVLMASWFLILIAIPMQQINNIFSKSVSMDEIVAGNYDESFIGQEVGDGVPVLSTSSTLDDLEYEDLDKSFFTVGEVEEIIPLDLYEIKARDTVGTSYSGSRRQRSRGYSTDRYITGNDRFAEFLYRFQYDRVYVLKMKDGSEVFCTLNQDYYRFFGDNSDIKFPIGRADYNNGRDVFLDVEGNEYINESLYYLDMTEDISSLSYYMQTIFRGLVSFLLMGIIFSYPPFEKLLKIAGVDLS